MLQTSFIGEARSVENSSVLERPLCNKDAPPRSNPATALPPVLPHDNRIPERASRSKSGSRSAPQSTFRRSTVQNVLRFLAPAVCIRIYNSKFQRPSFQRRYHARKDRYDSLTAKARSKDLRDGGVRRVLWVDWFGTTSGARL